MATTPQPAPKPPEPKPAPKPDEDDGAAKEDPNKVQTVGEEQLARSQEMEKEGVAKYMADRDDRKEGDKGRVHPGVHQERDEPGAKKR